MRSRDDRGPNRDREEAGGKGIGRLVRELLLDPVGYPHAQIAARVNATITGAKATDKSVRWYADAMRKKGLRMSGGERGQRFNDLFVDIAAPPKRNETAEKIETLK